MDQDRPLTIGTVMRAGIGWLTGHGHPEPRITVELLLARAIGHGRSGLYARLGDSIEHPARATFDALLTRHMQGEPVAYILGEREFYGLTFAVRSGVLIPRPETELLVDETLAFLRGRADIIDPMIADVGTGSGCVAVAVATHSPNAHVHAVDISTEALTVATENALRHLVFDRIDVRQSDLLAEIDGPLDVVLGNLPYIPSATVETLDRGVRDWEPRLALDGGPDGLDPHRCLLAQLPGRLRIGGLCILEIADDRGDLACELARSILPNSGVDLLRDVFGRERALRVILG